MNLSRLMACVTVLALAASAQTVDNSTPITGEQRARWFSVATVGPASTLGGLWSSGYGVLTKQPEEYPSNTKGFGQRFGMRLTGVATGNAINATLGAAWGEDPRYERAGGGGFGRRANHVMAHTFVTKYNDGETRFAWARLAGNVGSNSVSNLWRVQSEVGAGPAASRITFGIVGQMSSNAFAEFMPDLWKKIRRK